MSDMSDMSDVGDRGDEPRRLDGNAAAGMLEELFTFDVTTAQGTCAGCGRSGPLGQMLLYGGEMGIVLRCQGCERVQLRVVRHSSQGERYWVEMRGMTTLQIAPAISA